MPAHSAIAQLLARVSKAEPLSLGHLHRHRTALARGALRRSDAPCVAPRGSLRRFCRWCPRLPGALLDVAPNESSHDLGGRRVLLGAQTFEESLLARIDEDGQSCSAVFESHGRPSRMRQDALSTIIIEHVYE
jgi:hypothetical protein